ncbi:hypothetical protein RRG08_024861 [Elysia crispata]|uniref:Uncharacterized protein n=1 Tax=Elysia crispata TaxID=231223 RepID=A0AAE0YIZ5_9GAST|nr:hypothetical protein RRG08_024861 [Elysia crispata]
MCETGRASRMYLYSSYWQNRARPDRQRCYQGGSLKARVYSRQLCKQIDQGWRTQWALDNGQSGPGTAIKTRQSERRF